MKLVPRIEFGAKDYSTKDLCLVVFVVPGRFLEGCNESDRDSRGHKGLRNVSEDVCSHEC